MSVLIGITQDVKLAKEKLMTQKKGLSTSTEVGPFMSKEKAAEWQHFMSSRRDNYEEFDSGLEETEGGAWYGLTFVQDTVH